MNPRGFAVLAVLWFITAAGVLVSAATLHARESVQVARYRVAAARLSWTAEGCAERARATLDSLMTQRVPWERLAERASIERAAGACSLTLLPAGYRLDVNAASVERIARSLRHVGVSWPVSDSMADALADWRDADDQHRPLGAESGWYRDNSRAGPRNAPLASRAELEYVRGFAGNPEVVRWFDVEPGRTPLNLAPLPVVATLPGVTPEVVRMLERARARGEWLREVAQLAERVSRQARDSVLARLSDLTAQATIEPEGWILTVVAHDSAARVSATLELRLARAHNRVAVVRRRTW